MPTAIDSRLRRSETGPPVGCSNACSIVLILSSVKTEGKYGHQQESELKTSPDKCSKAAFVAGKPGMGSSLTAFTKGTILDPCAIRVEFWSLANSFCRLCNQMCRQYLIGKFKPYPALIRVVRYWPNSAMRCSKPWNRSSRRPSKASRRSPILFSSWCIDCCIACTIACPSAIGGKFWSF
jgi:hypothetical protein